MGSKNLKAVAVRGQNLPPMINSAEIKKFVQWLKDNMMLMKVFTEFGTGAVVERYAKLGQLPVKNFQESGFANADKISAQAIREKIRVGMEGCFACPVRCKKVVEFQEPYQVDRAYGGPEYETLGALGSVCGIDNLHAVVKGNELCNAYSLDTISTGFTIAFAMECFERGLLTLEDTRGVRLEFGNAESMLKMIALIARREGIGNLLAEGSALAAKQVGHGSEAFAMHVKGLEFPMHEPRINKALALAYMVHPHGADHMDSLIDTGFSSMGELPNVTVPDLNALGFEPAPYDDIGPRKVTLFKAFQSKRFVCDSLVLCDFLPYSLTQMAELTSAVTGDSIDATELLRVGERIITMLRIFNIREGFTASDDKLPMRFFKPTAGGPLSNKFLDFEEMEKGKRYYYHLMGWNEGGVPTTEKLKELEVDRLAPTK